MLELIKRILPCEAVKASNSEGIERARKLVLKQYGQPHCVLDPFAGGGSIPLEALRLAHETYASDYNPVAVFIEKAALENQIKRMSVTGRKCTTTFQPQCTTHCQATRLSDGG